jgi:hypothetical protein
MATKRTTAEVLASANKKVEAAQARLASSPAPSKKVVAKKAPVAKKVSLELWPDAVRGVPNPILRSALFGTSTSRKTYTKRTVIAAVDSYEIRFLGTSFNQTDLDVWEMLLHLARLKPLGTDVEFTAHFLLKELGRGVGGKDHDQLKEELARLGSGWTEISDTKAKKTFAGNFISSFVRDDENDRYVVSFNPKMAQLYEAGHTLIDWSQRKALKRNTLAKWLHGQYASHAQPFPYKVETLRDLSGSGTTVKDFKQKLKKALDALKAVRAILNWSIDEHDLVHVVRSPSRAQLKHIQKKKP